MNQSNEVKKQIQKLETQYSNYDECTLGEKSTQITYVKHGNNLTILENSLYISVLGIPPFITKISEDDILAVDHFHIVLKNDVINEYVAAFSKSALGELALKSVLTSLSPPDLSDQKQAQITFGMPILTKQNLEQLLIALPPIEEQKQIISTLKKMRELNQAINKFENELALNPTSSNSIVSKLNNMLEVIGELTGTDKIRNCIRQGETKTIEFKETLCLNATNNRKEKFLEKSVLKTIGAFLNTEGGILLIGINDDGEITGVDNEIEKLFKNCDKYLLHFKNLIKSHIGEGFYPLIEYKIISLNNKLVLLVDCKKSKSECYLQGKDFYVRTNPATDKLEGPKLVEYVRNHFV